MTAARTRYRSVVTGVGDLAEQFIGEGVLIFFGENAPEELHEFAVLHRPEVSDGGLSVGDTIVVGDTRLPVLAVGDVADQNLVALGHLDLKANGLDLAPLPGDVCVPRGTLPQVEPGMQWGIEAGEHDRQSEREQ